MAAIRKPAMAVAVGACGGVRTWRLSGGGAAAGMRTRMVGQPEGGRSSAAIAAVPRESLDALHAAVGVGLDEEDDGTTIGGIVLAGGWGPTPPPSSTVGTTKVR